MSDTSLVTGTDRPSPAAEGPDDVLRLTGFARSGSFRLGDVRTVRIDALRSADSPRTTGEDDEHVRALAQLGPSLPPIVVHRPSMRVVDGVHRVRAAVLNGQPAIEARFFEGSAEEAFVVAVQSNSQHGLPLSRADRVTATARILASHPQWSDRTIAKLAGVTDKTVAALRKRAEFAPSEADVRLGRDGRLRPVDPAVGRLRAAEYLAAEPSASLRKVATAAGITPATAKDVKDRLRRREDPLPPRLRPKPAEHREEKDDHVEAPATRQATPVPAETFGVLARDPSLRHTEGGRAVLRLLHLHTLDDAGWLAVLDGVPAHCREAVAEVARACATAWGRAADVLDGRASDRGGSAASR